MKVTYQGKEVRVFETGGQRDEDLKVIKSLKEDFPDMPHSFGVVVLETQELVYVKIRDLIFE